ncbi:hypothetical protein PHK61_01120 [Actinomycetospora lutea]|uniref:hypothetical protein n=1 Tax=Actinomycetospora lutea TaxID=663604 RepID=UPI00236591A1|nr:hypothetical protein [Actinomycetospora lutea]MDD7937012.1 hypothetical protein [Actinomycetospora lutea]
MTAIEIVGFVVSPAHAYEGRPGDGPRPVPTTTPDVITIRAGHGWRATGTRGGRRTGTRR